MAVLTVAITVTLTVTPIFNQMAYAGAGSGGTGGNGGNAAG
jgi:hypothetical protein